MERSMRSAEIFAGLNNIDGGYAKIHDHYAMLVDEILRGHEIHTVYLRASVKTCTARVQMRDREGEDGISQYMMTRLHDRHEAVFSNACIVADAEADPLEVQISVLKALCSLPTCETIRGRHA